MSQSNKNENIMVPGSGLAIDISSDDHYLVQSAVLYVGTGGDLSVITEEDDTVVLKNVADGSFIPLRVRAVTQANTTATDIVALW